jgi:hypothetical protein
MVAPRITAAFGPCRSISHPATGPVGPPAELARAKTKEMVARPTPKVSPTGMMKTGNPFETAVLLSEVKKPPRVTIRQP